MQQEFGPNQIEENSCDFRKFRQKHKVEDGLVLGTPHGERSPTQTDENFVDNRCEKKSLISSDTTIKPVKEIEKCVYY